MMYGHHGRERSISAMEQFQKIFRHSLPAEYVAVFSQQTEAPEVRCDLTDTHTQTNRQTDVATTVTLTAHARRGLITR